MTEPSRVLKGSVVYYALFDLADQIDLVKAQALLGESVPVPAAQPAAAGESPRRFRLSRPEAQTLLMKEPPLDVALGFRSVELLTPLGRREARQYVRLFDYGSASVRFELEIPEGTTLEQLVPVSRQLQEFPPLQAEAHAALDLLLPRIRPALDGAAAWKELETYVVVFVERLSDHTKAEELLQREGPTLWRLLLGEPGRAPSRWELEDMRRHVYSYLDDDLVAIDWECAFVLEPDGTRDVPDVLEFARAQLIGLYSYDDQLDRELLRIYDQIDAERGAKAILWSPYGPLARHVQERWIDLTEFTERIENSIKVVGDLYLARVYRGALERYRVPDWMASVRRKQAQIAQVYELLKTDLTHRRSVILEALIVLLIVFEIVMPLLRRS